MMFITDIIIFLVLMVVHELTHAAVLFFSVGSDKIAGMRFTKLGMGIVSKQITLDKQQSIAFYLYPILSGLVLIFTLVLFIFPSEVWYILIAYLASCVKDMHDLWKVIRV